MSFWRARARGFTLVEMAIVLVVVGLLISGGLLAVAPVIENSKASQLKAQMDQIEQALLVYTIQNGCLPCPANPGANSTTAGTTAGQAIDTAVYTTGCADAACANVTQGVVPWINLGLSEADIVDPYGYRIDYAVTAALTLSSGMQRSAPSTYPVGTLTVTNTTPVNITTAAAFVLISHGKDRSLGRVALTGGQTADPNGSANQTANSDGSPFVQNDAITIPGATYFDDVVRFRTAPVFIQLCGANACGNPA